LKALGHQIVLLREVLPTDVEDAAVLRYAVEHRFVLITCNRDDFLVEAQNIEHSGIIFMVRRKTRVAERAALVGLLDRAGETGIKGNINFA
jgi:extradiol dioxygenase family protein